MDSVHRLESQVVKIEISFDPISRKITFTTVNMLLVDPMVYNTSVAWHTVTVENSDHSESFDANVNNY